MNPKLTFSRSQLESEIQLFQAKIKIQKELMESSMDKEVKERRLVAEFCKSQGFGTVPGPGQSIITEYVRAHERTSKAQEDAQRVNLKELESQVQIREKMLKMGE